MNYCCCFSELKYFSFFITTDISVIFNPLVIFIEYEYNNLVDREAPSWSQYGNAAAHDLQASRCHEGRTPQNGKAE